MTGVDFSVSRGEAMMQQLSLSRLQSGLLLTATSSQD
jgi:hypothetical protein